MAKMNWSRTRKYSGYEMKYAPGSVLANGYVVPGMKSVGEQYLDELQTATKKPKAVKTGTSPKKENWHALQAYVAAAGLKPSQIAGGFDGIKRTAMAIYGIKTDIGVTEAIRLMPKTQRRACCRKYRKENNLLHPKTKGLLAKQKRENENAKLALIREQLTPRS